MSNDVEAMRKGSRAVGTAEVTDPGTLVSHVSNERVFDLISEWKNYWLKLICRSLI